MRLFAKCPSVSDRRAGPVRWHQGFLIVFTGLGKLCKSIGVPQPKRQKNTRSSLSSLTYTELSEQREREREREREQVSPSFSVVSGLSGFFRWYWQTQPMVAQ